MKIERNNADYKADYIKYYLYVMIMMRKMDDSSIKCEIDYEFDEEKQFYTFTVLFNGKKSLFHLAMETINKQDPEVVVTQIMKHVDSNVPQVVNL